MYVHVCVSVICYGMKQKMLSHSVLEGGIKRLRFTSNQLLVVLSWHDVF